jgi:hypothetical protein
MALREKRGEAELAPLVDALEAAMAPLLERLAARFPADVAHA